MTIQYWILTFNRPRSLNRLIESLYKQGVRPNVYSNSQIVHIDYPNRIDREIINHMGTNESTSWCARSWNSIYLKALENGDQIVCLQDDTDVGPNFVNWINNVSMNFDFMFGPAGDQFHYITKSVIREVGWWDERYNGCYCADADYLRRVYLTYPWEKISVEETHGWGFHHNACGISANIIPRSPHNVVDPDYVNQHVHLDNIAKTEQKDKFTTNYVVDQARYNYETKWGIPLTDSAPCVTGGVMKPLTGEYDWYPWMSKKIGVTRYV